MSGKPRSSCPLGGAVSRPGSPRPSSSGEGTSRDSQRRTTIASSLIVMDRVTTRPRGDHEQLSELGHPLSRSGAAKPTLPDPGHPLLLIGHRVRLLFNDMDSVSG